ncbi:MAG: nucleotidyltransferase family protein [Desulfarculus sp.]|nr:nucleotidyltransferase family protein [Desulfarculus sp.]
MNRQQIAAILAAHAAGLRARGVVSLALFGSAARGQAGPASDIDLLVEFARLVGLFAFISLQHWLEDILGVEKVDLVERGALHPARSKSVLDEAIHVA